MVNIYVKRGGNVNVYFYINARKSIHHPSCSRGQHEFHPVGNWFQSMCCKHLSQQLFEPVFWCDLVRQTIDHRSLHQNGVQRSVSYPRYRDQHIECLVSSVRKIKKKYISATHKNKGVHALPLKEALMDALSHSLLVNQFCLQTLSVQPIV